MENNLPLIAKRLWSIVRVVLFMLRKGISKGKIMMDLNMMMLKRRRKLAGKAISNLMFHHHHHGGSTSSRRSHDSSINFSAPREYEFSCSNTPNNYFFPIIKRNRNNNHNHSFFACAHAPPTQDDEVVTVKAVLDMLNNEVMLEASPAIPGFGRSPMVRQLRVTDSPFPLQNADADDKDHQVDKAAEEFIKKFYRQLRNQN